MGSLKLFAKLWKAHTEIHEFGAKGHPKCDECGTIESRRDALEERRDEAAVELKKDLDIDQAEHDLAFAESETTRATSGARPSPFLKGSLP